MKKKSKHHWLADILSVSATTADSNLHALTDILSVSGLNSMPDRHVVCQWPRYHALTDLLSVSGTLLQALTDKKSVKNQKGWLSSLIFLCH